MSNLLYYCTKDNNTCPKKEECERYIEVEGKNHATLFKVACTEDNNYVLYIKHEKKEEDNNNEQNQAS